MCLFYKLFKSHINYLIPVLFQTLTSVTLHESKVQGDVGIKPWTFAELALAARLALKVRSCIYEQLGITWGARHCSQNDFAFQEMLSKINLDGYYSALKAIYCLI